MTPDEIHQMGLDELRELHGRMDPILQEPRLHQGLGRRAHEGAWPSDPRYKFRRGDPGRAEIMAFIQERLRIIRAQLPQVFNTLVRGNLEVRRLPPEEEPGAPGAYGGAGSIDGTDPRQVLDQPAHHRPAHASSTCPTSPTTRRSRATSGRANIPTSCR